MVPGDQRGSEMGAKLIARMLAGLGCGVIFGAYLHFDYVRWEQRGREAFLAHQAQRFDLYISPPQPMFLTISLAIIGILGALAIYEILAITLSRLFGAAKNDELPG